MYAFFCLYYQCYIYIGIICVLKIPKVLKQLLWILGYGSLFDNFGIFNMTPNRIPIYQ